MLDKMESAVMKDYFHKILYLEELGDGDEVWNNFSPH